MSAGLSGCPYYRGTGACGRQASCSALLEPVCVTGEPTEGWAIESRWPWGRLYARVRYALRTKGWWR